MASSNPPQDNNLTFTDWLRKRSFFIIDPIVTFLARYKFSPDALTVIGTVGHFLLAWLIGIGQIQLGGIAMMVIAPLDALDGSLARKLGRKQGGFGAFLDSTLDRLAEIILFAGFIFYYVSRENLLMLALAYTAICGSLMVSYSRAKAESLGLTCKVGVLGRVERYLVLIGALVLNLPDVALIIITVFGWITVAQRIYHVWRQTAKGDE